MLGLDYGSSDEEYETKQTAVTEEPRKPVAEKEHGANGELDEAPPAAPVNAEEPPVPLQPEIAPNGPALGPSMPSQLPEATAEGSSTPLSPYSAARTAIRELTMPPVLNTSIPDSPPGSPPAGATKRFANFLELKKKGVHFNSKLSNSAALRNPGLLQNLMEFAGIDEYDQYAMALSDELAVPISYPPWAYGEALNRSQQQLLKKKEDAKSKTQRDRIDFVSGADSRGSTPGRGKSAAERVMSGLDRERGRPDVGRRRRRSRSR